MSGRRPDTDSVSSLILLLLFLDEYPFFTGMSSNLLLAAFQREHWPGLVVSGPFLNPMRFMRWLPKESRIIKSEKIKIAITFFFRVLSGFLRVCFPDSFLFPSGGVKREKQTLVLDRPCRHQAYSTRAHFSVFHLGSSVVPCMDPGREG